MSIEFKKKYGLRARILSATPLICLIVYLILGFGFKLWHPGWVIFLLIPMMPCFLGMKQFRISYPLICIITYIVLGCTVEWGWHPGWIILLTIPLVSIFTAGTKHSNGHITFGKDDKDKDDKDKDDQVIDVKD